jgi:hypothetical protein
LRITDPLLKQTLLELSPGQRAAVARYLRGEFDNAGAAIFRRVKARLKRRARERARR